MMVFWLWVVLFAVLAAVFVMWPLLRNKDAREDAESRNQQVLELFNQREAELLQQWQVGDIDNDQYRQLQDENELSLLEDSGVNDSPSEQSGGRRIIYLLAILVPVVSFTLYWQRGAVVDEEIRQLRSEIFSLPADTPAEEAQARYQHLIDRLLTRLESTPDNLQHWYLLSRLALSTSQYELADRAYQAILDIDPQAGEILAERAQLLFIRSNNTVTDEVKQLASRALEINPQDTTALGLLGIEAFQSENYAVAVKYWEKTVALLGPMTPAAQSLQQGIARAKALSGDVGATSTDANQASTPTAKLERIKVHVALAEGLKVNAGQTVFVYARAVGGPKMPLAIARMSVADLPATVTLDKSMSMMQGMSIASFEQVELVARVSESGGPVAQSGDWQVISEPLNTDQEELDHSLLIKSQIP